VAGCYTDGIPMQLPTSMKPSANLILTLTGPSTAGKTVLSELLEDRGFAALVSTTTRPIRKGEEDGVHYHFLNRKEFYDKLAKGEFIEYVEYDNNAYGICSAEAQKAFDNGKPAILVAEPHGSEQIHTFCQNHGWSSIRVFVNNPIPVLLDRLLRRFAFDADVTTDSSSVKDDALSGKIDLVRTAIMGDMEGRGTDDLAEITIGHLRSFARDIGVDLPSEKLEKLLNTHGRRIGKILSQEQEEWVKPAYADGSLYDLVIDEFNEKNTEDVVQRILLLVNEPRIQESPRRSGPRA
jgi:guanylate kinase